MINLLKKLFNKKPDTTIKGFVLWLKKNCEWDMLTEATRETIRDKDLLERRSNTSGLEELSDWLTDSGMFLSLSEEAIKTLGVSLKELRREKNND